MIKTIEPIVYWEDKRRTKTLSGIVTEVITSFERLLLEQKYKFDVLFIVDGAAWKTETFFKSYAEVDGLKQYVLANNNFGILQGSELEDAILKVGLMVVAIQDQHFGITPDKWRFVEENEPLFLQENEEFPELPPLEIPEETSTISEEPKP